MPPISPSPLSDAESDTLAELLDAYSPFDFDGLLGVLHAVGVAPAMVLPSAWLPVIVPSGFGDLDANGVSAFIDLVMRQYNHVIDALERDSVIVPLTDDSDGCESFATGYVAAAAIAPEWIGNDDRWSFAAPIAYLADRLEYVPEVMLADIERNLAPDPKKYLREQLGSMVVTTSTTFEKYRRAHAPVPPTPRQAPVSLRVGRNDPCTCGSGKKFKRCCARRAPSPS